MNRVFPPDGPRQPDLAPPVRDPSTIDNLLREARRLLSQRSYAEVVRRLEVHRPAEWAAQDESGLRLLRLLSQAYLGRGSFADARECLEHLRAVQKEKSSLSRDEYAAALSDLCKCYRALTLEELARDCQDEARRLLHGA